MKTYDPTDPTVEITYLKAQEKQPWPDPAKPVKKIGKSADPWPKPSAADKKIAKLTRRGLIKHTATYAPFVQGGMTAGEIIRTLLIFGSLIALALLID